MTMTHEQAKGIEIGRCPKCNELIAIDLMNGKVEGGKFESITDDKYERVYITCPECGHREEEPRLRLNVT